MTFAFVHIILLGLWERRRVRRRTKTGGREKEDTFFVATR